MDQTIAELSSVPWEDQDIEIRAACGVSALGEQAENIDDLLEAVAEACSAAEALEDKHVFIAGHAESKRREQLDRVGSYVRRALDRGRLVLLHDTVRAIEREDEIPPTLYLLVGAAGAPVWADGASGAAVLVGPTAGYLAGLITVRRFYPWLADLRQRRARTGRREQDASVA